jgi:hypothetical protein
MTSRDSYSETRSVSTAPTSVYSSRSNRSALNKSVPSLSPEASSQTFASKNAKGEFILNFAEIDAEDGVICQS